MLDKVMTKQYKFLYIVQISLMRHKSNALNEWEAEIYIQGRAVDAIELSSRIPDELTAAEAAAEFTEFLLRDDNNETARNPDYPNWMKLG